jgi:hypothetical protein
MLGKSDVGRVGVIVECVPTCTLKGLSKGTHRDAHLRNCWELHKRYGMNIIFSDAQIQYYADKGDLEYICISYGSFYAPHRACNRLMERNPQARLFWLTNEYNIQPPGYAYSRKKDVECISNFEAVEGHGYKKWHFLNLNTILARPINPPMEKKYGCIYYGTFRVNRTKYFRKYLQEDMVLSTNSKNLKKYKHIGCAPKWTKSLSWEHGRETLGLFKYSLYIEDDVTHTRFNNLANRFYEALFCRTVMLFCRSCKNTVEKSGIILREDMWVDSYEDVKARVNDSDALWQERLEWQMKWNKEALEEKEKVLDRIGDILMGR